MPGPRLRAVPQSLPEHARMLLAIRRQRRWTQRQLAEAMDVSTNTIARWERGDLDPHPGWMRQIRALLLEAA